MDNRYRLDERIAAGGVGQVWKATDLLLERAVAVKLLRPEYADHPETLERFRKEAKNAGALNNPHVAQVYDYGPVGPGGSPYLVMEFVDGPSLADLLVVDPIEPHRALDVIAQAADGLAAAHKVGVIHRDIKPGNILISSEGQVKVTDFGIAHAAGQVPVTGPGLVMGTTQYMAPERIAGNPGTAASDLYALGIVLHECLTGVPPHDGTAAEVMAAHLYLPLPALPANVPPELDVLVDRLTTKDPARRISDARELADVAARLRDAIGGGPLLPPARGPAPSGPGAAAPGPVSQAAAFAAEQAPGWGDGGDQGRPFNSGPGGNSGGLGNTALLSAPGAPSGDVYVSDEWKMSTRMSLPTGPADPAGPGQAPPGQAGPPPGRPRRKGLLVGSVAAGTAVIVIIAVLAWGPFKGTPAANQGPAGSATSGTPTTSRAPSQSASGAASTAGPSGTTGPSTAAPPATATASPGTTASGKKPSKSPSARPGTSSPAGSTPTGTSGAPTGGSTSGAPSTSPASTPSTPASVAPSPTPTKCLLGIICN